MARQGPFIIIVDQLNGDEVSKEEVSDGDEVTKGEVLPWEYYPGMISSNYFNELLLIMEESCKAYPINIYGKIYESKRKTCIYTKPRQDEKYYHDNIPVYLKDDMPEKLAEIWTCVEDNFKIELDYVLVHIYRDHDDYLGWHNDKEALDSEIISVSLGATRRFQFRPIKDTKGYSHELALGNGDVVHMKGPNKDISPYGVMSKAQVPNKDISPYGVVNKAQVPNKDISPYGVVNKAQVPNKDISPYGVVNKAQVPNKDISPYGVMSKAPFPIEDSKYQILRDGCQRNYKHQIPQMTANDMKNHLTESGCMLPSGRLTKDKLIKTMIEKNVIPIRINLTFRQY
jgi:alkylated DNA repair dioxygenase AlkB